MTTANRGLTRRHVLAATGAGVLAAGFGARPAFALETVRQGYQTNMWGMPTYYLLRSGLLEKHGVKFEEFAVPSGNLTMQQMVARQVDMGTYAGPSFAIGHDKGGLVAIAMIEYVGKTARVMARKDLNLTKVEQLKGLKVANQTGSSTGNIFVDQIATKAGLKKGDYQEIRMNVNDMVAAMAAKTVDAMVNVEPYNAIAEADGLANRSRISTISTSCRYSWLRHRNSSTKARTPWSPISRRGSKSPRTSNRTRTKSPTRSIRSTHLKGYTMVEGHVRQGAGAGGSRSPGWPSDLMPYMTHHAEILVKENKIKAVPDWNKAFRTDS